MRILRAFLGSTFVYAGVQKFADPNFLRANATGSIGDQLRSFAQGSPIGPVLSTLAHVATPVGVVIALVEICVGLGTLLGIAPVTWAATGATINVILFLSATWHVYPYFLGSDSIYAVAWGALLAGLVEERGRRIRAARATHRHGSRRQRAAATAGLGRREFLRGAVVGAGAIILGAGSSTLSNRPSVATAGPSPSAGKSPSPSGSPAHSRASGTVVASLRDVAVGDAVSFHDPAAGPAILCRLGTDRVVAYSRVCTHAGCLVEYDRGSGLLFCPCHGAEFDPAHQAVPVAGPAPTPLTAIPVRIEQASGQVVASS